MTAIPSSNNIHFITVLLLACLLLVLSHTATAGVVDLLSSGTEQTTKGTANSGDQQATESNESGEEKKAEEPLPKPSAIPVQPTLDPEPELPLESKLSSPQHDDIRQQIQNLRQSLEQRQSALESSKSRLAHAQSLLKRLDNEYRSFELRLEKAGLNLTYDYARLLRQRLERLRSQTIASGLTQGISEQLSAAREEQLRLEEYEAIKDPDATAQVRLRQARQEVVIELHAVVTKHIDVLDEYYNTVVELQERFEAYQELLQQRLFWLPSAVRVDIHTIKELYQGTVWFVSAFQIKPFFDAMQNSLAERSIGIVMLLMTLVILLVRRRTMLTKLTESAEDVGNVSHDRFSNTLKALLLSFLLALPGVIALSTAALMLKEGNNFIAALSSGFSDAAFMTLLLGVLNSVARRNGLGERHFNWNGTTLAAIRKQIPMLLAVLLPVVIILPTMETPEGTIYSDSIGRLLFTVASLALAWFAYRVMTALRQLAHDKAFLKVTQQLLVATPLLLAIASLWGYHYTAVELEGLMFISTCWLAFMMLLYYLALRSMSVRERRMTLKRLLEQRAAERKLAEAREAAENSGEGVPVTLNMPEMDLADISQQSKSLVRILAVVLSTYVLWIFWADVIPALQVFDNITLWTISTDIEGESSLPVTLGDLMLALLIGVGTFLAIRNLPGTLEVTILSHINLEPGAGYAITTLVTYFIVLIGLGAALAVIGLQWAKLQWLVAALGVGLGFGLQEIVANFVSGIILLFERPIRVGDTVTIGETTGTVSRIRIRATTLVDWDRKEQIIPNKTFVTQDLTNWTLSDPITRVIIRVGVAYGSDVDQVRDILHEVVVNNERVVEEPAPAVFCVGLGDSSLNFEVRAFVRDIMDFMPLSHEMHSAITNALKDAEVEIPFPQRDIHIRTAPVSEGEPVLSKESS
ncbi:MULTISPECIES: mechanosensitive ion channel domain-containing protein [Methylophaga]